MATVTKSFEQYKKGKEKVLESSLSITVDFDVHANEIEKIISVEVYSYDTKVATDITAIMAEQFSEQLDSMIESVDWREMLVDAYDYETA